MVEATPSSTHQLAGDLFRREGARIVARLTAQFGTQHLQLAEDAVQEALLRALQTWPYRGLPENPAAWLMQTARNSALDSLRRQRNWQHKEESILHEQHLWQAAPPREDTGENTLEDATLRMLFVCFHPQLSLEAQTALALRVVCALSPAEIAAAFLTSEAAVAKRLVRARQRVRELALPFILPAETELPERLDGVLRTIYLFFNEGYKASSGEDLVKSELCHEAMRIAEVLSRHPLTAVPRTHALLALMRLTAARLPARTSAAGELLRLHEQDRSAWDASLIAEGLASLSCASSGVAVSPYHLEAGIAALHSLAADEASTDWQRILGFYDQLLLLNDSPIVAMNRAVAVCRVHGAQAGLEALDAITDCAALVDYHLYHAIYGSFHAALGHTTQAVQHLTQAASLASLPSERAFLSRRLSELEESS